MRIVIVGDGKVGFALAQQLSADKHDVVIIDKREEALKRANETLDALCIRGNGASGSVLREAGVGHADLFIAATSSDEMNMVCCLTAKQMGATHTIARIRDYDYAKETAILQRELGISMVINPEQATASELARLLRFPSVTHVEPFVKGRVEMVGFTVEEESPIAGQRLAHLRRRQPGNVLFAAMERDGEVAIPNGDTVFQSGDHVYVIGEPAGITQFFKTQGRYSPKMRDVILLGGGRIGQYLAHYIRKLGMKVKIIDIDPKRCQELAEDLPDLLIINADGTDPDVLEAENIEGADAVVALTNRDEDNLMTALYAIQCGVPKVIAKSNRTNYNNVCKTLGLETIINPKHITVQHIIHFVRGLTNTKGTVMETLYPILDGRVECAEFSVSKNTGFLEIPLRKLKLRPGILVAVIVRGKRIIIPGGEDHISADDSVILIAREQTITQFDDIVLGSR